MKLFISKKYTNFIPKLDKGKNHNFTTIIFTIIALIFFGVIAINPTFSTISKLNKEISDSEIIKEQLDDKISDLASLQNAYSRIKLNLPKVLESIPETPEVPLLIGQAHSIAKDLNIKITHIKNDTVNLVKINETEQNYYSFEFTITGESSYENIMAYIERVTNMQRIISIDTLYLTKLTDQGTVLQFNLQGIAYYKK